MGSFSLSLAVAVTLTVAPVFTSLFSAKLTAGAELLSSSEIVTVYSVMEPKLLPATDDKAIVNVSLASLSASSIMVMLILFSAESPSDQLTVPEADSTSSPIMAVPELKR